MSPENNQPLAHEISRSTTDIERLEEQVRALQADKKTLERVNEMFELLLLQETDLSALEIREFRLAEEQQISSGPHPRQERSHRDVERRAKSNRCRFYGPISNLSVGDFLQFVLRVRHTGRIRIVADEYQGVIYLQNGEAVYAEAGEQTGFQAFYHLVNLTEGHFEFTHTDLDRQEPNLPPGTLYLIMEALRRKDEHEQGLELPH